MSHVPNLKSRHIVVLTGAGMSAESGIKTFRDADGLWEGHDVMEVASPQGFRANPELVLDFYNQRRRQLLEVEPNAGHLALAELEKDYNVSIITQNVDDLHERANSSNILHLHGELLKMRSTKNETLIYDCKEDINVGDMCEENSQLRPHIVWFGEAVTAMDKAVEIVKTADILIIVGTSMQVYPAAGLVHYTKEGIPIYFIDPNPAISEDSFSHLTIIQENATIGIKKLVENYL
ncbi:MAG: NAD-dependent protein deacylase [Flavobacteriales bacterium]|nr:MAG: NAD-dependent protein deacylase [Flavobacteriales bacterium]PIE48793.1 MAG: NAD-dependent protein deacylase [Flavobacteriales bacterium]